MLRGRVRGEQRRDQRARSTAQRRPVVWSHDRENQSRSDHIAHLQEPSLLVRPTVLPVRAADRRQAQLWLVTRFQVSNLSLQRLRLPRPLLLLRRRWRPRKPLLLSLLRASLLGRFRAQASRGEIQLYLIVR